LFVEVDVDAAMDELIPFADNDVLSDDVDVVVCIDDNNDANRESTNGANGDDGFTDGVAGESCK
jgi:hypothetical protein